MADDSPRPNSGRTPAEVGSPEFAEDRTQINSLNNKRIHEEYQDLALTEARRSRSHYDDLLSRGLQSFDQLLTLQSQLNQSFFSGVNDRARLRDQWNYITAYDLSNPATTGSADSLRANVAPANRVTDSIQNATSGGVAVSAEAVAAAVAKQVDATVTPVLAVLQQVVSSLATTQASIANVLAQTQPKTATGNAG